MRLDYREINSKTRCIPAHQHDSSSVIVAPRMRKSRKCRRVKNWLMTVTTYTVIQSARHMSANRKLGKLSISHFSAILFSGSVCPGGLFFFFFILGFLILKPVLLLLRIVCQFLRLHPLRSNKSRSCCEIVQTGKDLTSVSSCSHRIL